METITESPIQSDTGFDWRKQNGVLVLKCMPLEADGFTNAFSTRLGGVSPMPENDLNLAGFADDTAENIYENRRRFLGVFEDTWKLTSCWQVHGDAVRHVTDHDDAGIAQVRPSVAAGGGELATPEVAESPILKERESWRIDQRGWRY